jgi:signal transduction histidine kinase
MVQLNEELEQRIAERTAELNALNHELAAENFECFRLERRLAKISEFERQRMGHELHDVLGQQITAIGVLVETLHQRLEADALPHADAAACLRDAVQKAKADMRALSNGLFPVDVHAEGLRFALEELARRTCEVHNVSCTFTHGDVVPIEDNYRATHLFWIASEAVRNAAVHARPRHITIRLEADRGLKLTIQDDGIGLGGAPDDLDDPVGMGLRIMRHRARLIGGKFDIESPSGGGTVVTCGVAQEAQDSGPGATPQTANQSAPSHLGSRHGRAATS